MSLPSEFYVTLASDESSDYFNTVNKEPNFTNKLSSPLLFKEPYVVALTEIYIPPWNIKKESSENIVTRAKREILLGGQGMIITLKNFNAEINIPVNKFLPIRGSTWKIEKLLPFFLDHIIMHDSKVIYEPRAVKLAKKKLKEDFENLSKMNIPFYSTKIPKFYHYFKLGVPYQSTGDDEISYYYINIPIKTYPSLEDFFKYIISFVPKNLRNDKLLDVIFKEISKENDSDSAVVSIYKKVFREIIDERAEAKLYNQFNNGEQMEVDNDAEETTPNTPKQPQIGNIAQSSPPVQSGQSSPSVQSGQASQTVQVSQTTQTIDTIDIINLPNQVEDDENDMQVGSKFFTDETQLHMLFVYTDIISPHMYANKMFTLLRVIPNYHINDQRNGLHIKFNTPEFYPVCKDYFETIEILISNREYEIELLQHVKNPIYIKLLFRKA